MRALLSNKDYRLMRIMESLRDQAVSFETMMTIIGVSSKTLNADIIYINGVFDPIQVEKKNEMLYLAMPLNLSFANIYPLFLTMSKEFQALEEIFFHGEMTIEELAEILFFSESSLRRMISRMNQVLKKEKISVQFNPVKITGDESSIRNFFIQYFMEKCPDGIYPFNSFQKNAVNQLLSFFFERNNIDLMYTDLEKLHVCAMVALIRMQQENHLSTSLATEDQFDFSLEGNIREKKLFKSVFNLELTKGTIVEMAPHFFSYKYAHTYAQLVAVATVHEDIDGIKRNFENWIEGIAQKFQIDCPNQKKLVLDLCNVYFLNYGKSFILYDFYSDFVNYFKSIKPKWVGFLLRQFKEIFKNEHLELPNINNYIYLLVSHWKNLYLILEKKRPSPKVGIFYNTDIEHTIFVKNMLESQFREQIEFELIESKDIEDIFNLFQQYDFVITNIPKLDYENILCFSIFPTLNDFATFRTLYYQWLLDEELRNTAYD